MIADQDSARLIIADDHPIVLQGLENLITSESAFSVVASCSDGAACMRSIRDLAPDIAVVDMAMPAMTGLEVLSCVIAERLSTKVVFLAASFSDSEIVAAARGGAYGIMLKDTVPDVCLLCLREVASGRKWLPPEFVQSALDRRTERN